MRGELVMPWQTQHPGISNVLHLVLLAIVLLAPVVLSHLLASALE